MVNIPEVDWTKCPLKPGNPARGPSDGWKNWFDYNPEDVPEIVRIGELDYLDEWRECGEKGLVDIAEAAKRAGISDVNARLNEAVGKVGANIVNKSPKRVFKILDIGCGSGNTSMAIWENLDNSNRVRVRFSGIDLSERYLYGAEGETGYVRRMCDVGADVDTTLLGSDLQHLPNLEENVFDLVVGVASLHQHGELSGPFRQIYRVVAKDGYLLTGDWHVHSNWKHPAVMKRYLLSRFDFPGMDELLEQFDAAYPLAKERPPEGDEKQEASNREIADFWIQYAGVINQGEPRPAFRFHEGHRPAEDYIKIMESVGFRTAGKDVLLPISTMGGLFSNPHYLRPESALNAVTLGRKMAYWF